MINFSSSRPILEVVDAQKSGRPRGVYSICSANPLVIEACLRQAAVENTFVLVESTCNQVNQFGGYTGMKPLDFRNFVAEIAGRVDFPAERIVLGGDHLGPNPWQNEPSEIAMDYSRRLVCDSVKAGYTKIHLDTSMTCADDPPGALDEDLIASRAADLCAVTEKAADAEHLPVYVIGTEVPVPGGEKSGAAGPRVTPPEEARSTIELFRAAFKRRGLVSAWERVIGLVVQPGVEFGDDVIYEYRREEALSLSAMIESVPGIVYEAHSTDYQQPVHLRQMVEDHFAVLKVGPGLTFAMREAIFALAEIERQIPGENGSRLIETAECVMLAEPKYWIQYYSGSEEQRAFARKYSLSDRMRYYWTQPELQEALARLVGNLRRQPIPLALLSQYLPDLYDRVREKSLPNDPLALIHARIQKVAGDYLSACRG